MSTTRANDCCGRESGFHAPGCTAQGMTAHDAAISQLRDTLQRAKALALDVCAMKVNFWAPSVLFSIERAEFEVRYYLDVEQRRREDEEKKKKEGTP